MINFVEETSKLYSINTAMSNNNTDRQIVMETAQIKQNPDFC